MDKALRILEQLVHLQIYSGLVMILKKFFENVLYIHSTKHTFEK